MPPPLSSSPKEESQHLEIKEILDHKMDEATNTMVYLVRWKDPQMEPSYVRAEDFDQLGAISKYHKKVAAQNKANWKSNDTYQLDSLPSSSKED